jgi:hypothetical protein
VCNHLSKPSTYVKTTGPTRRLRVVELNRPPTAATAHVLDQGARAFRWQFDIDGSVAGIERYDHGW